MKVFVFDSNVISPNVNPAPAVIDLAALLTLVNLSSPPPDQSIVRLVALVKSTAELEEIRFKTEAPVAVMDRVPEPVLENVPDAVTALLFRLKLPAVKVIMPVLVL